MSNVKRSAASIFEDVPQFKPFENYDRKNPMPNTIYKKHIAQKGKGRRKQRGGQRKQKGGKRRQRGGKRRQRGGKRKKSQKQSGGRRKRKDKKL